MYLWFSGEIQAVQSSRRVSSEETGGSIVIILVFVLFAISASSSVSRTLPSGVTSISYFAVASLSI
jgi:hypothetical protein